MNLKEKKFFLKNGYLIKENILNFTTCEKIKKILNKAILKESNFHNKFKKNKIFKDYGMVMVCHYYDSIFLEILKDEKLIKYINYLLGKESIVYAYTSSSMAPQKKNFSSRIHRDTKKFIKEFITNIGCTISLDDFIEDNGATEFLPKSHLFSKIPKKLEFDKKKKKFICKKGSVLIFHGQLFHRGGHNKTNKWRHALTINFCRSWMKQRFEFKNFLKKKYDLTKLDKKIRQKLGLNSIPPSSLKEYYGYNFSKSYK